MVVCAVGISQAAFAGPGEDIQNGVPIEDALRDAVEAGMTIDQAVGDAISTNPEWAGDVIAASHGILNDLPGAACMVAGEDGMYVRVPTLYVKADSDAEKSKVTGPYTVAQVRAMLLAAKITLDDEVSKGQEYWHRLDFVEDVVPKEMSHLLAWNAKLLRQLEHGNDPDAEASRVTGPHTEAQVRAMLLEGKITLDDEVSSRRENWYRLGLVENAVPEKMYNLLARGARPLSQLEQGDLSACMDRIAAAAIEAGADPAVVTAATAAGDTGGMGGPGIPPGPGDGNRGGNLASVS
ncbi:hypothetical protein MNBD_GAMMA26-1651 [hydrothermal vent metagenome]|uniref:Uncharacterized protein n=1 Tax=hydrothermal vent metagenome TaxID=652676 RepID=A0A3B1AW25_9ZZZZ